MKEIKFPDNIEEFCPSCNFPWSTTSRPIENTNSIYYETHLGNFVCKTCMLECNKYRVSYDNDFVYQVRKRFTVIISTLAGSSFHELIEIIWESHVNSCEISFFDRKGYKDFPWSPFSINIQDIHNILLFI